MQSHCRLRHNHCYIYCYHSRNSSGWHRRAQQSSWSMHSGRQNSLHSIRRMWLGKEGQFAAGFGPKTTHPRFLHSKSEYLLRPIKRKFRLKTKQTLDRNKNNIFACCQGADKGKLEMLRGKQRPAAGTVQIYVFFWCTWLFFRRPTVQKT